MNNSKLHPTQIPLTNHSKTIQGKQLSLFPEASVDNRDCHPVNVASVPQRSPFRYPGGKTWFVPTFMKWINSISFKPRIIVEPFAGGGIISLTALFEEKVEKAVMVELDEDIAAVWQSIIRGESEWLATRILNFELNRENLKCELDKSPETLREKAFQTILRNRTLHGGILANGSGYIKNGEHGKGIKSRWYPSTLARRIRNLNEIANRIEFRCGDGLTVMNEYVDDLTAVFFIDPPYTAGGTRAGTRLYKHYQLDHEYLFSLCRKIRGEFLLTYDNADEVREMAKRHGFQITTVPMTNTHHITKYELIISNNLQSIDGCC